jgi:hypothetical protein
MTFATCPTPKYCKFACGQLANLKGKSYVRGGSESIRTLDLNPNNSEALHRSDRCKIANGATDASLYHKQTTQVKSVCQEPDACIRMLGGLQAVERSFGAAAGCNHGERPHLSALSQPERLQAFRQRLDPPISALQVFGKVEFLREFNGSGRGLHRNL